MYRIYSRTVGGAMRTGGTRRVALQRVSCCCCCPGLQAMYVYVRGQGGDTTIKQGGGTLGDGSSEVLEWVTVIFSVHILLY